MMIDDALNLDRLGYGLVLLKEGTKGAYFRGWQNRGPPTRTELHAHLRRRVHNLGIRLSGLAVIDLDGPEGLKWAEENGISSPMVTQTKDGLHLYFRNWNIERNIIGFRSQVDILVNGYSVCSPSEVAGHSYSWNAGPVRKEDLQVIPVRPEVKTFELSNETRDKVGTIISPERYCLTIESIQGCNGSKGLVRVVKIFRDAGRSEEETFNYIWNVWNAVKAVPPWNEKEVLHAIHRNYRS